MFSDQKKSKKDAPTFSNNQNKIAKGTKIIGDIISEEGGFRIEGTVEGNIKTKGRVVVAALGQIKGDLECINADFEGSFSGKMIVKETLSLKSGSNIEGEVTTGRLSVEPNAVFNATCKMESVEVTSK